MLIGLEQTFLRQVALFLIGLFVFSPQLSRADIALLKKADKQIATKKYKIAVRTITKAMNKGELSDSQMASALYKRGTAFNGMNRHSAAIADLTGAIWLGKLDKSSRKLAYQQRALAYQNTGHKNLARRDITKSGLGSTGQQRASTKPASGSLPPVPSFNTVVRTAKRKTKATPPVPSRTKIAAKPVVKKKAAIPAFRTTIATE